VGGVLGFEVLGAGIRQWGKILTGGGQTVA